MNRDALKRSLIVEIYAFYRMSWRYSAPGRIYLWSVFALALKLNTNTSEIEYVLCHQLDPKPYLLNLQEFQELCGKLLAHRLTLKQKIFVFLKQVVTWNVGGAAVARLGKLKP